MSRQKFQQLNSLSEDQIGYYEHLISGYLRGMVADNGWLFHIESSLKRVGCPERLAFVMAVARSEWKQD